MLYLLLNRKTVEYFRRVALGSISKSVRSCLRNNFAGVDFEVGFGRRTAFATNVIDFVWDDYFLPVLVPDECTKSGSKGKEISILVFTSDLAFESLNNLFPRLAGHDIIELPQYGDKQVPEVKEVNGKRTLWVDNSDAFHIQYRSGPKKKREKVQPSGAGVVSVTNGVVFPIVYKMKVVKFVLQYRAVQNDLSVRMIYRVCTLSKDSSTWTFGAAGKATLVESWDCRETDSDDSNNGYEEQKGQGGIVVTKEMQGHHQPRGASGAVLMMEEE